MAKLFERKQQILDRIPSGHHRDYIDQVLRSAGYPELISDQRVVRLAEKEGVTVENLHEEKIGQLIEEWVMELDSSNTINENIPVRVFIDKCASSGLFFDQSWSNLLIGSQRVRNVDVIESLILYFHTRSLYTGIKPNSRLLDTLVQIFEIGSKEYEAFRYFRGPLIKGWLRAVLTFSFIELDDEKTISNLVVRSIPESYHAEIIEWAKGWGEREVYVYPEIWDTEFLKYFLTFMRQLTTTQKI